MLPNLVDELVAKIPADSCFDPFGEGQARKGVIFIGLIHHSERTFSAVFSQSLFPPPYRFHFTKSSHHVSLTAFLRLGRMAALRGVP